MNIEHYRQYQTFKTVKELDLNVRAFLQCHKPELSEGNLEILRFIWRHSVKYPGVSFAKIATIVKKTGRSRSTVIRTINRFEAMGLLKRVETLKPNGKRGVNILIFQPLEGYFLDTDDTAHHTSNDTSSNDDEPSCEEGSSTISSTETEEKQRIVNQEISNDVKTPATMDSSFLPSYIPSNFIAVAKPFLSVKDLYNTWKSIRIAFRKVDLKWELADYMDIISKTFKEAVFAFKEGRVKKSLIGYFYGGLQKVFDQQVKKERREDSGVLYYDWINEGEYDNKVPLL